MIVHNYKHQLIVRHSEVLYGEVIRLWMPNTGPGPSPHNIKLSHALLLGGANCLGETGAGRHPQVSSHDPRPS